MGCKAEIPDEEKHASRFLTKRCNKPILRGGYCAGCLPTYHNEAAERARNTMSQLNAELKHLLELDEPMLRTTTITIAELMFADIITHARKHVEEIT